MPRIAQCECKVHFIAVAGNSPGLTVGDRLWQVGLALGVQDDLLRTLSSVQPHPGRIQGATITLAARPLDCDFCPAIYRIPAKDALEDQCVGSRRLPAVRDGLTTTGPFQGG